MEFSLELNEKDKFAIKTSLNFLLSSQIEGFVINFYEAYLKKETLKFIQKTTNESLINMFTSFLNIITSYFVDSTLLDEHIEFLLDQHSNFKNLIGFPDIFIGAFMTALVKSLGDQYDEKFTPIWQELLTKLVNYIRK